MSNLTKITTQDVKVGDKVIHKDGRIITVRGFNRVKGACTNWKWKVVIIEYAISDKDSIFLEDVTKIIETDG